MEKEFIPYEQALALKELGFDEPCFGAHHNENNLDLWSEDFDYSYVVKAPLYQQVFRWFREKYVFYVIIQPSLNNDFTCVIWTSKAQYHIGVFKTYEEAELECLKKLIEIVKEKFAQLKN